MRKKIGILCIMACLFAMGSLPAWAGTRPTELTGRQWILSNDSEKLAFLYGASSIVAIEEIGAEKTGRPVSRFVEGWMNAFKDLTLPEIQRKIDVWYATHSDQADRNVFDVIWYEMIKPAQGK